MHGYCTNCVKRLAGTLRYSVFRHQITQESFDLMEPFVQFKCTQLSIRLSCFLQCLTRYDLVNLRVYLKTMEPLGKQSSVRRESLIGNPFYVRRLCYKLNNLTDIIESIVEFPSELSKCYHTCRKARLDP